MKVAALLLIGSLAPALSQFCPTAFDVKDVTASGTRYCPQLRVTVDGEQRIFMVYIINNSEDPRNFMVSTGPAKNCKLLSSSPSQPVFCCNGDMSHFVYLTLGGGVPKQQCMVRFQEWS